MTQLLFLITSLSIAVIFMKPEVPSHLRAITIALFLLNQLHTIKHCEKDRERLPSGVLCLQFNSGQDAHG